MPPKRVVVLGLDAMVVPLVERFAAQGLLPVLSSLIEDGCFSRIRSVIPAQTPTNWHTIATGAAPGTHGIVQWGSKISGRPVWEFNAEEAFNSGLCNAEYLWEAAAKQGRKSVVMNYAGYPATTPSALFIDRLFTPMQSYYDLAKAAVHDLPGLETKLEIKTTTEGSGPELQLSVVDEGGAYDTVFVSNGDPSSRFKLRVGQWSDWMTAEFETADQGELAGAFRLKLLALDPNSGRPKIFSSDAFPADGRFCSDQELGERIIKEAGPYVHSGSAAVLHTRGDLDWETAKEVFEDESRWWSEAALLAADWLDATLVILHWHILDLAGHRFIPTVDPTGTSYEPASLDENWEVLANYYQAADSFVRAFLDRFDDGETAFVVVSDHGMPANQKAVSLVNIFREKGWVTLTEDGKALDRRRCKVSFAQNHLWINLKGRDQDGIVPPEEYEQLQSDLITLLRDLKDPETGRHVFSFVLSREEAPVVGLWGDYIGDVVICYAGGYKWSGPEVLAMGEERVVFPAGGGNHGPMIPTYETDVTSNLGAIIMRGPGIRRNVKPPLQEQSRVCTTDVAPTLAHLLGLNPPAQSDGRVLTEFMEDLYGGRPSRTFRPTMRPIRREAPPKPVLQGDVTDDAELEEGEGPQP